MLFPKSTAWVLIFLLLGVAKLSTAQSYSPLIYDASGSPYVGAYDLGFLHRGVYKLTDKLLPDSIGKAKSVSSIGYRVGKLVLLDGPIDDFISLIQHEVFGHGARYREFGSHNNTYELNLSFPYGSGGGSAMSNYAIGERPTSQQELAVCFGGVEANRLLANHLTNQSLLDDSLHYRQGLLLFAAQNDLFKYLLGTRYVASVADMPGNDMVAYIKEINGLYSSNSPYSTEKLYNQSLVSWINPMQLYSLVAVYYNYLIKGQKHTKIPMIKFGDIRYLPALNYSLTPFGSQYHFVNYLRYKQMLFSADFTLGDNTFNNFYGMSLKGFNLIDSRVWGVNMHLDVWNQPELELASHKRPSSKNSMGGAFKTDVTYRPFNQKSKLGLFTQAGYKTKGYTLGESLDEGFILRFGLSCRL